MNKIKVIQRYLPFLQKLPYWKVIIWVILSYLSFAIIFGIIYFLTDSITFNSRLSYTSKLLKLYDYFYFSFITQSTVGYGDFIPKNIGKLIAIFQAIIGMTFFAVGTGLIIFKLLLPHSEAIRFDQNLIFYPIQKRFRFRFANQLSVPLHDIKIFARLRRIRITDIGEKKKSRKTISLLRDTIPYIPEHYPWLSSTKEIVIQPKPFNDYEIGETVQLSPNNIERDCEVKIYLSGFSSLGHNYFAEKTYTYCYIKCGKFKSIPHRGEFNWDNIDKYEPSEAEICQTCSFYENCMIENCYRM